MLFLGHMVVFLFPSSVLSWNSDPVRLIAHEGLSFTFAVAVPLQWGPVPQGNPPMTGDLVISCIDNDVPILWCDHGGYPGEMFPPPSGETLENSGHAKIIAGYDNQDTADFNDDEYYIFHPWPTSVSPYWVGSTNVLDPLDVYITDYDPTPIEMHTWGGVKRLYR